MSRSPHPLLPLAALLLLWASPASAEPFFDLDEANALKDGGACGEAVFRYEALLVEVGTSHPVAGPARYNQALCFEELGAVDSALDAYRALASTRGTDPETALDARFRAGLLLIAADDDAAAAREFKRVAGRRKGADRAVVDLQLAWIDLRAGRLAKSRKRLSTAAPAVLDAAETAPDSMGWYAAQASLLLGDVFSEEARRVRLAHSRRRPLTERLATLAAHMERAEQHYVDSIDRGAPRWAAASLLHLGDAYSELRAVFADLHEALALEEVRGMAPSSQRATAAWLGERLTPTARKAHQAWSLCADMPREMNRNDRFTDACRERLRSFPLELLLEDGARPGR